MPALPVEAEARLNLQQRFRIARARAWRLLERDWDEGKHPRVPAGNPDGGQFGSGGGAESKPGKGKGKKAKKEDFDKAKIGIRIAGDSSAAGEAEFIENWNEKIGIEPEEFKASFLGGVDASMNIVGRKDSGKFDVRGEIEGDRGRMIGNYEREIDLDGKKAYSAYFKLEKSSTKNNIGKKVLAGNIETYKKLGVEQVGVTANIDVGGYAWAKYGYVPTQAAWNAMRGKLESRLGGGGSSGGSSSGNTMEADDWEQLSSDVQDDVRDRWMRDSYSEFLSSEEQNWRDSGQAKDDAKSNLSHDFGQYDSIPEWVGEALDAAREDRATQGMAPIPYSNKQLYDAIELSYESNRGDGTDDPEISFDDGKLQTPVGYDPSQQTLPGIEPEDPAKRLTDAMREEITNNLVEKFDSKATEDADEAEMPSYLADSVSEYQDEYWSQKDDSEKLSHAIDYGMADIEIEPDEDDEASDDGLGLNPELFPKDEDPVLAAARSSDPKSIWKIADSPRGKELLLGTSWSGVLNLKDKESMDRFDKYVGHG